jgi:hypothetical protein
MLMLPGDSLKLTGLTDSPLRKTVGAKLFYVICFTFLFYVLVSLLCDEKAKQP